MSALHLLRWTSPRSTFLSGFLFAPLAPFAAHFAISTAGYVTRVPSTLAYGVRVWGLAVLALRMCRTPPRRFMAERLSSGAGPRQPKNAAAPTPFLPQDPFSSEERKDLHRPQGRV